MSIIRTDTEDAERYRWLRKHFTNLFVRTELTTIDTVAVAELGLNKSTFSTDALTVDKAVDAVMKANP